MGTHHETTQQPFGCVVMECHLAPLFHLVSMCAYGAQHLSIHAHPHTGHMAQASINNPFF